MNNDNIIINNEFNSFINHLDNKNLKKKKKK